jgi:hypothetical protein
VSPPRNIQEITAVLSPEQLDEEKEINADSSPYALCDSNYEVKFVSHRTHKEEDLGVDHIFIKPELFDESIQIKSQQQLAATLTIESPPLAISHCANESCVFVEECKIYPCDVEAATWFDNFHLSDHRPIGSNIIFGKCKGTDGL